MDFFFLSFLVLPYPELRLPSKAEIADRQAEYNRLAAAKVAHNVIKGKDGYYAKVKKQSCFLGSDNEQYCKFR